MSEVKDPGKQGEFLEIETRHDFSADVSRDDSKAESDDSRGIDKAEPESTRGDDKTEAEGTSGGNSSEAGNSGELVTAKATEDFRGHATAEAGDSRGDVQVETISQTENHNEATLPSVGAAGPEQLMLPSVLFDAESPEPVEMGSCDFKGVDCFFKGCKWSPDGTCILANSNDNMLRLWDMPSSWYGSTSWSRQKSSVYLKPAVRLREGGMVYDFNWHPLMSSWDPATCCYVTATRGCPGHLWDAFTGTLRSTYRSYNEVDEVEAAHCAAFNPSGDHLYFGFNNKFRVFRTEVPGRDYITRDVKNISSSVQRGIVSCITFSPVLHDLYAVGSYLKTIGLYSEKAENSVCILEGHTGGITHLRFSPDGIRLYSGGRMDPEIVCWDLRKPGEVLWCFSRNVTTHQRIYFDLTPDGRYLLSGMMDGSIAVWDTENTLLHNDENLPPTKIFDGHKDCANGVSIHPYLNILASCSGQRQLTRSVPLSDSEESENDDDREGTDSSRSCKRMKKEQVKKDFSLKLWWTGAISEDGETQ